MRIKSSQALVPLLVLTLSTLSACVDEKVVFEDPGDDPGEIPTAAAGFVGYQDHASQLTFCGTCHTGKQEEWLQTTHSKAWANLQVTGHVEESCEECHATNELGNAATQASGYNATMDPRYQDVQCESCHGAGLEHIQSPSNATVPKAPLNVGTTLTTGCGECHRTAMTPYLEEWGQSRHQNLAGQASNPDCTECHSGDGALVAWGIDSDWAEKTSTTGQVAITCAVCHDPHGVENDAQLRFPVNTANLDTNLCMKCHQRRAVPEATSLRGPHSPEGPTLLGQAGWWPAGQAKTVVGTHGTVEGNPNLCATCHMKSFQVTDGSGAITYWSRGHTFEAIPCIDAAGKPYRGTCDETDRSFASCTGSGCHGTEDVARSAMMATRDRIDRLSEELKGLLDQVPAAAFNANDPTITAAEGAAFNRELAVRDGAPIHNPFLIEQLLLASIQELSRVYGVTLSADVSLTPTLHLPGN